MGRIIATPADNLAATSFDVAVMSFGQHHRHIVTKTPASRPPNARSSSPLGLEFVA
jgi:hypothetical protein